MTSFTKARDSPLISVFTNLHAIRDTLRGFVKLGCGKSLRGSSAFLDNPHKSGVLT